MTVYNVIIISHGEILLSLDGVYTFTSEKDARKKLKERYNNVLSDVVGYEITDEEFGDKYYRVEIDDDEGSIYEGYIRKTELKEKDKKDQFYDHVFSAAQCRVEGGLSDKECDFITEVLYNPEDPDEWSWSDFYDLMDCINEEDGNVIYALQANYDHVPDIEDDDNFLLVAEWMEQHPKIKTELIEEYCDEGTSLQTSLVEIGSEIVLDVASMMEYKDRLDCLLYVAVNKKAAKQSHKA